MAKGRDPERPPQWSDHLRLPTGWRGATVEAQFGVAAAGDQIVLTVYTATTPGQQDFSIGVVIQADALGAILAGQFGRPCQVRIYDVEDVDAEEE